MSQPILAATFYSSFSPKAFYKLISSDTSNHLQTILLPRRFPSKSVALKSAEASWKAGGTHPAAATSPVPASTAVSPPPSELASGLGPGPPTARCAGFCSSESSNRPGARVHRDGPGRSHGSRSAHTITTLDGPK